MGLPDLYKILYGTVGQTKLRTSEIEYGWQIVTLDRIIIIYVKINVIAIPNVLTFLITTH